MNDMNDERTSVQATLGMKVQLDDTKITKRVAPAECGQPCERFPIRSAATWRDMTGPQWLIDGVLVMGGVAALYGAPGSYKTFVALDWSLSVANEVPWAGRDVQRCPVLYVSAEGAAGPDNGSRRGSRHMGLSRRTGCTS